MPTPPDGIPPLKPTPSIAEGEQKMPTEAGRSFGSYMEGGETNPLLTSGQSPQVSPFDLAHGRIPAPGPNFNTIQQQALTSQSTMGDISNQLNTPKLKLKQSSKYLLRNKLTAAKKQILSASNKLGAPIEEGEEAPAGAGPLQQFLSLVASGQNQLQAAQNHLTSLAKSGKSMKPADMLLVQIKLSKAQQQLEFSSMLLSKAVDDLKMMMNIQL
ncbi:MAG: hypothetical protein KR126chlam1_00825 [Chlamydiae bacterium]|nr:hypothetical protein [Chlamydiota bacterium]